MQLEKDFWGKFGVLELYIKYLSPKNDFEGDFSDYWRDSIIELLHEVWEQREASIYGSPALESDSYSRRS